MGLIMLVHRQRLSDVLLGAIGVLIHCRLVLGPHFKVSDLLLLGCWSYLEVLNLVKNARVHYMVHSELNRV
jgi:hypothetical protein